jgi:hypothetical protein
MDICFCDIRTLFSQEILFSKGKFKHSMLVFFLEFDLEKKRASSLWNLHHCKLRWVPLAITTIYMQHLDLRI